MAHWSSKAQIVEAVAGAHAAFKAKKTRPVECRRKHLEQLKLFMEESKEDILEALHHDLGKPKNEGLLLEYAMALSDINRCLNELDEWVKPEPVKTSLLFMMDDACVRRLPLGVVTIIVPWNYPLLLTIQPLAGAIAAGNCVVLKPSENAMAMEKLLCNKLHHYLDEECFPIVCGGVEQSGILLEQRVDHIFFTGCLSVAKIVMRAASVFCTPITLELGGKSPVIVDSNSDLATVARRTIGPKIWNAGQTCVAGDYILCQKEVQGKLAAELAKAIKEFLGENPQKSPDYSRIINQRHFKRVKGMLDMSSGEIVIGGEMDESDLYIAPTVLVNVEDTDELMKEEIFGPLLPIVAVDDIDHAIRFVNSRERPLALYVFSRNQAVISHVANNTISGTFCANDTMVQGGVGNLPFGGVGQSGFGTYHGRNSFTTFSHGQGYLNRPHGLEFINKALRYPPTTPAKMSILQRLVVTPRKGFLSRIPTPVSYGLLAILVYYLLKLMNYAPF